MKLSGNVDNRKKNVSDVLDSGGTLTIVLPKVKGLGEQ